MNGVSRFLSRRDKRTSGHSYGKSRDFAAAFRKNFVPEDQKKKRDKDEENKVKEILRRLATVGIADFKEPNVEYALRAASSGGDVEKALELLILLEDSIAGIVKEYRPEITLLGAENRSKVTCYLDALLFAMYARLDSFEALLYDSFTDEPRKRLACILRLWVNMLRRGKLITVDITKHLQEALAACGWDDAKTLTQQDTSEAFTFITGKLELPLLTLKMDIYHTGKEDAADDHKFVNERLLEVAIPAESPDGSVITLEDCLETYFNNRIEVKRHLARRYTVQAGKGGEKSQNWDINIKEMSSSPSSPIAQSLRSPSNAVLRTSGSRRRAESIFSERYVEVGESAERTVSDNASILSDSLRKTSIKKEVLMPAWQFFSLIPWYTDNAPTSDLQVAAHFASKRPVLGICLKRYSMQPNGKPARLDTYIDIPLEIGLPHFISDDRMQEDGPLFGNFKLSLQSVVCHRGVSVDSGHYIALVRGAAPNAKHSSQETRSGTDSNAANPDAWLQFDDLANQRVTYVDINKALKEESPYLLFYQVQPIDEDLITRGEPPPYSETVTTESSVPGTGDPLTDAVVESTTATTVDVVGWDSQRASLDLTSSGIDATGEGPRGRSSTSSARRESIVFDEPGDSASVSVAGSLKGPTGPTTPAEEGKYSLLGASRRGSKASKKGSKSRPSSQSGESRLSFSMSRLTARMSRDKLTFVVGEGPVPSATAGPVGKPVASSVETANTQSAPALPANDGKAPSRSKSKREKKHRSINYPFAEPKKKTEAPDRECLMM